MIEVLKKLVDALENHSAIKHPQQIHYRDEAIKAGKQAIAELESQEPRNVRERWNVEFDGNDLLVCFNDHEKGDKCQYERYSPQRTWVGLTDDEHCDIWYKESLDWMEYGKAIEAKLKENNT